MEAPSDILERNLRALERTSKTSARLIEGASPRLDLSFVETDEDALSAAIGIGPASRALASKRRPLAEAERLADTIDVNDCGGVVVLGFGVGHHVASIGRRMGRRGVVIVFETDLSLMRSVLERIDHSDWIENTNLVVISDADDAGAMAGAVRGVEGILALGVKVLEHPPSRPRLGHDAERFTATLTQMISAMRATLVTTLVQVETTMRNELMNLDHYATTGGVAELAGIGAGRPAIVVAAGPSLQRNIELLEDPDLRRRVVIIAVQTVLKPLLERGIRPHFVTALDYHEISRRFYEGLTPEDVEGVTLIAEAKANPVILDAFPGEIRCPRDGFLDQLLGPGLARPMGAIEPGATVAHLAYYVARHLGCDPVILTGQDLGFTDGQYYAAGAAIHAIWAAELNEFNTLEMMEWQRIVRARRSLRKLTDVHGRSIYTDEQMNSYLVQFERDFASDAARGLRILDATEGGVRKRSTDPYTLADALRAHASVDHGDLPVPRVETMAREQRLSEVGERVAEVRAEVKNVARDSRRAKRLLEKMTSNLNDTARVNRLITDVREIDAQVNARQPAFSMVQHLNQTGVLNRFKADRAIDLDDSLSGVDKQRRQIERDITNVSWLADAADQLGSLLDAATSAVRGGAKLAADVTPAPTAPGEKKSKVAAMIVVDPDRHPLGASRSLEGVLQRTLQQLGACTRLKAAVLITHEADRVRPLVADVSGLRIEIVETKAHPMAGRLDAVRSARVWAAECWRGGLASMTCYDELLAPTAMQEAMKAHGVNAAVLVGADWVNVDPALVDEVIERHLQRPAKHRIVFSQAPPGLGACLIDRELIDEIADKSADAGSFASIAGLVGYVPIKPQADPIAKRVCVAVDPTMRDAGRRFDLDASNDLPARLTLELVAARPEGDFRACDEAPADMPLHEALRIIEQLGERPLTLAGRGDALLHDDIFTIIERAAGPVHVRTDLRVGTDVVDRLCDVADVISIDLLAEQPQTYRDLTGVDAFDQVRENVNRLLARRRSPKGDDALPTPWVVPRITRCDATYEEIELFFDRWTMSTGCAIIDPLPRAIEGDRIEPLEPPALYQQRRDRTDLTICADLTAHGELLAFDGSLTSLWAAVLAARAERAGSTMAGVA